MFGVALYSFLPALRHSDRYGCDAGRKDWRPAPMGSSARAEGGHLEGIPHALLVRHAGITNVTRLLL
jgi:hypothetical protein